MNCREFELAWLDDDESLRSAAEKHAEDCNRCAEVMRGDREILGHAAAWKQTSTTPPVDLERRITSSLSSEGWIKEAGAGASSRSNARRSVWFWAAAAAAVLIIGVTFFTRPISVDPEVGTYESAIAQVEDAQRNYVKAIAELEQQAEQVLARSEDPSLDSRDAAILLNHRGRLAHLDSVIAEVQAFLDENPGHARGHTVLLAAYVEKDELLREILAFSPGEMS